MPITQVLLTATAAGGGGGGNYPAPGSGSYQNSYGNILNSQGTPYDPGAGVVSVNNSTAGWAYYIKDGQFLNDTSFFNGVSKTGNDPYGGFGQISTGEYFAIQWLGYIYIPSSGTYNIALTSDDLLYFWFGYNALFWNYSNYIALSNNGTAFNSNSLDLVGGNYYPIRMQFQEWSGDERAQVFFGVTGTDPTAMNNWALSHNGASGGH